MSDRDASVLAQRLIAFAPDMFSFLLLVFERCRDEESGKVVLNCSQMNELSALVYQITHGLDV